MMNWNFTNLQFCIFYKYFDIQKCSLDLIFEYSMLIKYKKNHWNNRTTQRINYRKIKIRLIEYDGIYDLIDSNGRRKRKERIKRFLNTTWPTCPSLYLPCTISNPSHVPVANPFRLDYRESYKLPCNASQSPHKADKSAKAILGQLLKWLDRFGNGRAVSSPARHQPVRLYPDNWE